jgi:hypothetical protein
MVGITLMSPLVGPSRPMFQRGLYGDAFGFQLFPATKLALVDGRVRNGHCADERKPALLVASPPARDLLFCAKHLFVAAKIVWHGLQLSRCERDWLGKFR